MSEQPAPPIQRYLTTAGAMAVLLVMAAITWYSNSAANAALEQVVLRNVKLLLALQSIDRQVKEVRFRVAGVVLDQMPAPGSRQHLGEAGTAIPRGLGRLPGGHRRRRCRRTGAGRARRAGPGRARPDLREAR